MPQNLFHFVFLLIMVSCLLLVDLFFPYLKKIMIDYYMAQLATVSSSDRTSKAHRIEYFILRNMLDLMLDL